MNHMFLGAPTKEEAQILDQLRFQLKPMTVLISNLQADMVMKLHQGQSVDWPHIRRTISTINSYLTSVNGYINGSYKREEETTKDSEGNPQTHYRDIVNDAHAKELEALHVFPTPPYPLADERLGHWATLFLDKRLGTVEEGWVEDRLRKASEFAYVPGEWDIEPKKAVSKTTEEEDDESDDDMKGWDEGIPTKRVKGTLNEDEIMWMWGNGHKTAFDKQYWEKMRFGMEGGVAPGEGAEKEAKTPAEGEDQDMEDGEEYEDEDEEEDEEAAPPAPVVMIQRAPPSVHKPVPGTPVMALGFVHRFMTTGETGKR